AYGARVHGRVWLAMVRLDQREIMLPSYELESGRFQVAEASTKSSASVPRTRAIPTGWKVHRATDRRPTPRSRIARMAYPAPPVRRSRQIAGSPYHGTG